MKPPRFEYVAAHSTEEALAVLHQHGWDAKPLAGGQSLIPMLNFRLARPAVLVDLNRLDELAEVEPTPDGGLRIGAMTRQRTAERSELVRERAPLLAEVLPWVAHPQIRNRGTVGGSAAHADPAAELPAALLALEARFRLQSSAAARQVGAAEFFAGLFATALEPDELLISIELPPIAPGAGWAFDEVARRQGDYALVGAAAVVRVDREGVCEQARVVYVNAGPLPLLAAEVSAALVGGRPSSRRLAEAARAAATALDPPEDVHATVAYRRHLAEVLGRRVLERAFARAAAGRRAETPPVPEEA